MFKVETLVFYANCAITSALSIAAMCAASYISLYGSKLWIDSLWDSDSLMS